jgi:ABC-2 type transport system permease protein
VTGTGASSGATPAGASPGPGAVAAGATSSPAAAASRTGSIYDLGYRRYDGVRLGRRHAIWALYIYSLRGAFGIGRSGRAKIAPFGLALLALLPALIAVGIAALVSQSPAGSVVESPIQYATYLSFSGTLLILFCAAQAPELVGRDQRYNVLPLYFSRALRRSDYALAKLAALWTALALVFLAPEALIFAGRVLAARDVPSAFAANVPSIPPILGVTALAALVLGGISLSIASYTPRRSYATAAIIAAFIVPPIVAGIIAELSGGLVTTVAALLDPVDLLDGANSWLFGRSQGNDTLAAAGLPRESYVPVLLVYGVVTLVATLRRYLRIAA